MAKNEYYDFGFSLENAIKHSREAAFNLLMKQETQQEGKKQLQMAKWLEELRDYRASTAHSSGKYRI